MTIYIRDLCVVSSIYIALNNLYTTDFVNEPSICVLLSETRYSSKCKWLLCSKQSICPCLLCVMCLNIIILCISDVDVPYAFITFIYPSVKYPIFMGNIRFMLLFCIFLGPWLHFVLPPLPNVFSFYTQSVYKYYCKWGIVMFPFYPSYMSVISSFFSLGSILTN